MRAAAPFLRRIGALAALTLLLGALPGCAAWLPPPMTAAWQQAAPGGAAAASPATAGTQPVATPPGPPLRRSLQLSVPFVALDDAAQARLCGPQALAMVLRAQGLPAEVAALTEAVYLPARGGSLQVEVLAAARRSGAYTVRTEGSFEGLQAELAAGHPVLVLLNLGLSWGGSLTSRWHYAVVIGVDHARGDFILHNGNEAAQRLPFATFEYTWARASHWAAVALTPGELPASASPAALRQAAFDFARVATAADQVRVWRSLRQATGPLAADLAVATALADALEASGDAAAAAEQLERDAPRLGSAVLWNNLAALQLRRGRWAEAQSAIDAALALTAGSGPEARWREAVTGTADEIARARPATP
ncbi:MAG: hypothetical protein RL722_710 [Pseudomonadota bacterium]|jgi:hypothetical protein